MRQCAARGRASRGCSDQGRGAAREGSRLPVPGRAAAAASAAALIPGAPLLNQPQPALRPQLPALYIPSIMFQKNPPWSRVEDGLSFWLPLCRQPSAGSQSPRDRRGAGHDGCMRSAQQAGSAGWWKRPGAAVPGRTGRRPPAPAASPLARAAARATCVPACHDPDPSLDSSRAGFLLPRAGSNKRVLAVA